MGSIGNRADRRLRGLGARFQLFLIAVVLAWAAMGGMVTSSRASAATIPQATFVDFAQCANDAPASTSTGCPGGWINGILQANNSHYAEDQVTPQRLEVRVPAGSPTTGRTITIEYQARKGSTQSHAYDSLATWNFTQTSADRCAGLSSAECVPGPASTFSIPWDCTEVAPATAGGTAQGSPPCGSTTDVTARHQLPNQVMTMYGGAITDVSTPVHSAPGAPGTDDYAQVVVTYSVASTATDQLVQLLFGGHLASGVRARGWGSGLGAASINGGPYHFKFLATDAQSIGNRDNQISAGGILAAPSVETQLSSTSVAPGTPVTDVAILIDGASNAGGTVTYNVYSGSSSNSCTGTPVMTSTVTVTNGIVPRSAPFTPTASQVGSYEWQAFYSGDAYDLGAVSACGSELLNVSQVSSTTTTNASPRSGRVGQVLTIGDTATVTGSGIAPTGTVSFTFYADATCSNAVAGLGGDVALATGTGGVSTATYASSWTPPTPGTFYWFARYSGDARYLASHTGCADSTESVVISKNGSTTTTNATSKPQTGRVGSSMSLTDVATVTGSDGVNPTGSVNFTLYADSTCTTVVIGVSGSEALTAAAAPTSVATHNASWTPASAGTYYWHASYSGDSNYDASMTGCSDASEAVIVGTARTATTTAADPGAAALGRAVTISDTATVKGAAGTAPTGTVTFTLYASSDCTHSVASVHGSASLTHLDAATGTAQATYATSWTPTAAGTYYWAASYSGDANYEGSMTGCSDAAERVVVAQGTTTTTTRASSNPATGNVGSPMSLTDVATVTGQGSLPPLGTVTFTLYASTDCTSAVAGVGGGETLVAASAPNAVATHNVSWTPLKAGVYYWHASYSGDPNYSPSSTGCADSSEAVTVNSVTPTVSTLLSSSSIKAGESVHDSATLAGATSDASGTVTFVYFSAASCQGDSHIVGTVSVTNGTVPDSATVRFDAARTYYWQALYSGDSNNEAAASDCNSEVLTVDPRTPALTTSPSPTLGSVGMAVHDSASLVSPIALTGTVSFAIYGPGDVNCQTDLVADQAAFKNIPMAGGVATSPDYTTTRIGVYQWVARYSGDAGNSPVAGACPDSTEQVTTGSVLAETGGFDLSLMLFAPPFLLIGALLVLIARRRPRRVD